MLKPQPVIFLGHGAPMNATRDNEFTRVLRSLGAKMRRPNAVVVFSAHWETYGTKILATENPEKMNDFFGDHPDLHVLKYQVKGEPDIAKRIQSLIPGSELETVRGIDHGVWSPLIKVFPEASIPTLQVSLDTNLSSSEFIELGRKLSILRNENILFIGSGNIVHAIKHIDRNPYGPVNDSLIKFDLEIAGVLEKRDRNTLGRYEEIENANIAAPTREHMLPLLVIAGMSDENDHLSTVFAGFEHGSMSLRSVMWD